MTGTKHTNEQIFYYKHNRLQQLRGFCFAAQFGNITRAAKHMGLTQSSVSLQIKALEEDMGSELFTRHGPSITLTPAGNRLLDMALPLINGIENLREEFNGQTSLQASSELHIGVNAATKNYLLPTIMRDYLKQNPDIRVILHYAEHSELMTKLENGAIELAILGRHDHLPFPKSCDYTPIFYCKSCLITLPNHPLAGRKNLLVEEILRHPLSLPAKELQVIPNLRETFGMNDDCQLRIGFVNSDTIREYVEVGLIITIAPDIWMKENDMLVATPLSHLFPDVDYGMVQVRGKPMSQKVRDLLDVMKDHALHRQSRLAYTKAA